MIKKVYKVKLDDLIEEDCKPSLPPSPRWSIDINPSCMPDGYLSKEKRIEFDKIIKSLTKNYVRCSNGNIITILEKRIYRKRFYI